MARKKVVVRRQHGKPRMLLDHAAEQWHGPRKRHIEKHAREYLRAFRRRLVEALPGCIDSWVDAYHVALALRHELPSLFQPPFGDEVEAPMPPVVPTVEGDNRPPLYGVGPYRDGVWLLPQTTDGAGWRAERIADGTVVPVEHRGATLHFGERVQYLMILALWTHNEGWEEGRTRTGAGPDGEYAEMNNDPSKIAELLEMLGEAAMALALEYVAANPDARIVGAAPPPPAEPGMYDECPPAQPTGEPRMDDGSHLLASERGRRRIDPETGRRMIRTMVLTDEIWPHWEWSEDVEGAAGVGPWGPGVSFGTPEEPAQMSPRESMRGHLTRIGRLDLLHKYLPWEGDPPL